METKTDIIQYAWDSLGSDSCIMVITLPTLMAPNGFGELRHLARVINDIKETYSYPKHIHSEFDCTGKRFGSEWKRLDWQRYERGFMVTLKHSWSIDI